MSNLENDQINLTENLNPYYSELVNRYVKNPEVVDPNTPWTQAEVLYTAIDCGMNVDVPPGKRKQLERELADGAVVLFVPEEIDEAIELGLIDQWEGESMVRTIGSTPFLLSREKIPGWTQEKYNQLRNFQLSPNRNIILRNVQDLILLSQDDRYGNYIPQRADLENLLLQGCEVTITWKQFERVKRDNRAQVRKQEEVDKGDYESENYYDRYFKDQW